MEGKVYLCETSATPKLCGWKSFIFSAISVFQNLYQPQRWREAEVIAESLEEPFKDQCNYRINAGNNKNPRSNLIFLFVDEQSKHDHIHDQCQTDDAR